MKIQDSSISQAASPKRGKEGCPCYATAQPCLPTLLPQLPERWQQTRAVRNTVHCPEGTLHILPQCFRALATSNSFLWHPNFSILIFHFEEDIQWGWLYRPLAPRKVKSLLLILGKKGLLLMEVPLSCMPHPSLHRAGSGAEQMVSSTEVLWG